MSKIKMIESVIRKLPKTEDIAKVGGVVMTTGKEAYNSVKNGVLEVANNLPSSEQIINYGKETVNNTKATIDSYINPQEVEHKVEVDFSPVSFTPNAAYSANAIQAAANYQQINMMNSLNEKMDAYTQLMSKVAIDSSNSSNIALSLPFGGISLPFPSIGSTVNKFMNILEKAVIIGVPTAILYALYVPAPTTDVEAAIQTGDMNAIENLGKRGNHKQRVEALKVATEIGSPDAINLIAKDYTAATSQLQNVIFHPVETAGNAMKAYAPIISNFNWSGPNGALKLTNEDQRAVADVAKNASFEVNKVLLNNGVDFVELAGKHIIAGSGVDIVALAKTQNGTITGRNAHVELLNQTYKGSTFNEKGASLLEMAIEQKNAELALNIVNNGGKLLDGEKGENGENVEFIAQNSNLADAMLKSGQVEFGPTLKAAIESSNNETVSNLMQYAQNQNRLFDKSQCGKLVNEKIDGKTPMAIAVEENNADAIEALMGKGAKITDEIAVKAFSLVQGKDFENDFIKNLSQAQVELCLNNIPKADDSALKIEDGSNIAEADDQIIPNVEANEKSITALVRQGTILSNPYLKSGFNAMADDVVNGHGISMKNIANAAANPGLFVEAVTASPVTNLFSLGYSAVNVLFNPTQIINGQNASYIVQSGWSAMMQNLRTNSTNILQQIAEIDSDSPMDLIEAPIANSKEDPIDEIFESGHDQQNHAAKFTPSLMNFGGPFGGSLGGLTLGSQFNANGFEMPETDFSLCGVNMIEFTQ